MELVVDIGNSRVKWGLFKEQSIISNGSLTHSQEQPKRLNDLPNDTPVIICTVSGIPSTWSSWLNGRSNVTYFDVNSSIPISTEYLTPETLGLDRLANVIAASELFKGYPTLVIDAGTCITLDLIDQNKVYKGGVITLGLAMRTKALNNYTDALPLVELKAPEQLVGKDTEQSLLSGIINGAISELDGLIEKFKEQNEGLKVVLTGGDLKWFEHVLKSETFADAFFTLKGLHAVLRLRKEEH